ncbi:MAG: prepilin-type cleavage/methylation domain-containing protein [Moraxellaceae bacterium]|nr:MAG: prepilin-type cleavage/methylation domain-containing protein [Moraxellaceae bacterium]
MPPTGSVRGIGSKCLGFTLIELIIVIVVMGILSVGSVRFISQSTQGVIDAGERQRVASIGIIAMEKISREMREALPNSIRIDVSGDCIEFVPTKGGSEYLTAPVLTASNTLDVIRTGYATFLNTTFDRVALFPILTAEVYAALNPGPISSVINTLPDTSPTEVVTLSSSHQFLTDSPERRFYIVSDPVTYCVASGFLYRYNNYGFDAVMGASRPTNFAGGREVIASQLTNANFDYVSASLSRNAVVKIELTIADGGEVQTLEYEVLIRNVP